MDVYRPRVALAVQQGVGIFCLFVVATQAANRRRKGYSPTMDSGSGDHPNRPSGDSIPTQLWNLRQEQSQNYQPREMENATWLGFDYQLNEKDVICGNRGAPGDREDQHPGNNRFKVVVELMLDRYLQAERKSKKTAVVREIVDVVRQSGGRFVRKGENGGWYDTGNAKAREKASTAVRTMAAKTRDRASHQEREAPAQAKVRQAAAVATPARDPEASKDSRRRSTRGRKRPRLDSSSVGSREVALQEAESTRAESEALDGSEFAMRLPALNAATDNSQYATQHHRGPLHPPTAAQSLNPALPSMASNRSELPTQLADLSGQFGGLTSLSNVLASNANFPMRPDLFQQLMASFAQPPVAGTLEASPGDHRRDEDRQNVASAIHERQQPPMQHDSPQQRQLQPQTAEGSIREEEEEDRKPPAK